MTQSRVLRPQTTQKRNLFAHAYLFRSEPCHSRCRGLILLETFTTLPAAEIQANLPPFVKIVKDVTGDPAFSMYNLALKSDWTDHFCHHELQHLQNDERAREAHKRFVETTAANNNNNNEM